MKTITLTIPSFSGTSFVTQLKTSLTTFFDSFDSGTPAVTDYANTSTSTQSKKGFKFPQGIGNIFSNKKGAKFIPVVAIALILMVAVGLFLRGSGSAVLGDEDEVSQEQAEATQDINKNFTFPVLNSEGDEVGKLQYTVQTAELREQLVIKGQQARAVDGRTFLIITIKLKNDTQHTISVNTRDFIRLKLANSDELLAPTIHNDPVEAQAISTLTTRVGFSIPEDQTDGMSLQIGEIKKDKQTVELNFN